MSSAVHSAMRSGLGFEFTVLAADALRARVRASGALDLSARDSIVEVLERLRDSGRVLVRLELTDVSFMDCSCLGALVEEHRRFVDARGQLVLTGAGPRVSRLLTLTGLDQVLYVDREAVSSSSEVPQSAASVVRQRKYH